MAQFQIGLRSIVSSQRVVCDRIVQLTVWIDHGRLYRFALQDRGEFSDVRTGNSLI